MINFVQKHMYAACISFFSATGALAALVSSVDKYEIAKNPNTLLSCSINSVFNCGTVLRTPYSEMFGIPLSFGGLVVFGFMFNLGFLLVQKPQIPKYLGYFYGAVSIFLFLFAMYLGYISSYQIGALCPWCQVSIASSMVVFFAYLTHAIKHNIYRLNTELHNSLVSYINRGYITLFVILWFVAVFIVESLPFIISSAL